MNADEIVKTLQAQFDKMRGAYEVMSALAEVRKEEIESLQAQLAAEKITSQSLRNAANGYKAQLSESQRRERAAVEDMTAVLKRDSDDICAYCKNLFECKGEGCECFEQGKGGTIDGKEHPDFKWTCEDFDWGTCRTMENTPCDGCFDNDYSGFEWRGPQEAEKGDAHNE